MVLPAIDGSGDQGIYHSTADMGSDTILTHPRGKQKSENPVRSIFSDVKGKHLSRNIPSPPSYDPEELYLRAVPIARWLTASVCTHFGI